MQRECRRSFLFLNPYTRLPGLGSDCLRVVLTLDKQPGSVDTPNHGRRAPFGYRWESRARGDDPGSCLLVWTVGDPVSTGGIGVFCRDSGRKDDFHRDRDPCSEVSRGLKLFRGLKVGNYWASVS